MGCESLSRVSSIGEGVPGAVNLVSCDLQCLVLGASDLTTL